MMSHDDTQAGQFLMRIVGAPAGVTAIMPLTPPPKLKAVAPELKAFFN
jgi:hypothetical protein